MLEGMRRVVIRAGPQRWYGLVVLVGFVGIGLIVAIGGGGPISVAIGFGCIVLGLVVGVGILFTGVTIDQLGVRARPVVGRKELLAEWSTVAGIRIEEEELLVPGIKKMLSGNYEIERHG